MIEMMMDLQKCNRKAKLYKAMTNLLGIGTILVAGMFIAFGAMNGIGAMGELITWDRVIAGGGIFAATAFTLLVADAVNSHRIKKLNKKLSRF